MVEEPEYPSEPLAQNNRIPVPTLFDVNGSPDEGLQLLFRLQVPEAGVVRFRAAEIFYRSGTARHRKVSDWSVYLCAPKEAYEGPGAPECGDDEPPFGQRILG